MENLGLSVPLTRQALIMLSTAHKEQAMTTDIEQSQTFAEFYPHYLREHSNRMCRRLHFAGSTAALGCLFVAVATRQPLYLLYALLAGYGFAWIGHFFFEKNKPASFKRPIYSFMGDWAMYRDIWTGKVSLD
jgi:hypothetical protein